MPIHDPLTQKIIGLCYRIANTLGPGFAEKVYENALAVELRRARISFAQQQLINVFYEGEKVGLYKADLVVEGRVIVEVKAVQSLCEADVAQGLNYLKATGLPICLLVNFGRGKIEIRRLRMGQGMGVGNIEVDVKDVE